jgi:hypothetical protein
MPKIEYVTIADHAEAFNGKLYLQGAGWSDITPPVGPNGQPAIVHMGIAVSVIVGWNETNRRFPLTIRIIHEDGAELVKVGAQIEAGRPPGIPAGSDLRNVIAIGAELAFPMPGSYELRAELEEDLEDKIRTATFRVHSRAQPGGPASFGVPSH